MDTRLPIDVVPGDRAPVFVWRQLVDTPNGRQVVDHRSALPPTVEVAVARLIAVAKQLMMDNAGLRGTIVGLNERIAALEAGQAAPRRTEAATAKKGK